MKQLFIAEKPSVAQEFAAALDMQAKRRDGYMEDERYIVTWCVGHLVTMSYPEVYDPALKSWRAETLPFIPKAFRYEVIEPVKKQFAIVSGLLKRADVGCIYVCTDSGREGEYIYRLVDQMAEVGDAKEKRRVWIDSQTREEILRGIREAKPLSAYDNLAAAAFLRAKEDYLMGINFSRALTLRYGRQLAGQLGERYVVVSAGRVMSCVLGMIVRREREIRDFKKTSFYKLSGSFLRPEEAQKTQGAQTAEKPEAKAENAVQDAAAQGAELTAEFRASADSRRYRKSELYKDSGFLQREKAEHFAESFEPLPREALVHACEKKKETKYPPLLYNLAELQNDCAKRFKISPDECLKIAQTLYERKLTTYPRTDARVLSTPVAKEITKQLRGLLRYEAVHAFASEALESDTCKKLVKSRYVDDTKITDHYAIIPTGQGFSALASLKPVERAVYDLIVRRFLAIFFAPAIYQKWNLQLLADGELFVANAKSLQEEGYLRVSGVSKEDAAASPAVFAGLRKGQKLMLTALAIKEGETSAPKRYTSGSMILAMENAGSLIEDEELRAQIKGSGIGTSATRAEILKKLVAIKYIELNQKTQVLTPTKFGELVTDALSASIRQLLNPELTASWEKGLSYVAEGSITEAEYMEKLDGFVRRRTLNILAGR